MKVLATIAACLTSIATFAYPTASAADTFTKKALELDVVTGPNNDVPCKIAADLYTPEGATKADPAPAILATNGFGGSKAEFNTLAPSYARRGYVFLAYSGLGFGGSGCKITLDDPDYDGKAGSQLVSFLGGSKPARDGTRIDYVLRDARAHDGSRRADDPRVGMIGGSYGGQIQFAITGVDPRMDALVPQITWNDLSYSLVPNNTDFKTGVTYNTPGVTKLDWPVLFFGVGVGQGFANAFADPSRVAPCPNFSDIACPALVQTGAQGYPSESTLAFLRHASVASYMNRIRIPTLLAQGENDTLFNLQESVATYRALLAQGTPVKLVWRSAGHSGGGLGRSESDASNPEAAYESRMALEWFDYYLRGTGDPPTLDFSFFRDWAPYAGDAAPAVGSTPSYPAGTDQPLYLSGSGALVPARGDVKAGSARFATQPAPTSTGGAAFSGSPATDAPGTFASFTSAPLTEDVDVVGVPTLTVKLDAPTFAAVQGTDPGAKLVLFAKLYDVNASGAVELPGEIVNAVRVADVTKPVRIELAGIAHRFAKGDRIRLVLAQGSATHRGNTLAGPVSVTADPAAPSVLTVPRLGAQSGAAGSGPSGTTPFTPAAGAPTPQRAGLGGPRRSPASARLPASRSCKGRSRLSVGVRKAHHGDRVVSAVVRIDGKVVKRLKGRALRKPVALSKLPRRTFRVTVTARTARGKTLRSARTYRPCAMKKKQ